MVLIGPVKELRYFTIYRHGLSACNIYCVSFMGGGGALCEAGK